MSSRKLLPLLLILLTSTVCYGQQSIKAYVQANSVCRLPILSTGYKDTFSFVFTCAE
jgi:hypothetical protein